MFQWITDVAQHVLAFFVDNPFFIIMYVVGGLSAAHAGLAKRER